MPSIKRTKQLRQRRLTYSPQEKISSLRNDRKQCPICPTDSSPLAKSMNTNQSELNVYTGNSFFNYMREYRKTNTAQKSSSAKIAGIWNKLTLDQKQDYRGENYERKFLRGKSTYISPSKKPRRSSFLQLPRKGKMNSVRFIIN